MAPSRTFEQSLAVKILVEMSLLNRLNTLYWFFFQDLKRKNSLYNYFKRVFHLDGVIQDVWTEPGGDAGGGAQGGRRVDLQQPRLHRGNSVGLALCGSDTTVNNFWFLDVVLICMSLPNRGDGKYMDEIFHILLNTEAVLREVLKNKSYSLMQIIVFSLRLIWILKSD